MKLEAIRLADVGRFSDPVAIEGLSPGLNLLAGPNEFGKSTIYRALEALILTKHTSKHRSIEAITPYGGGSPLVEADFEIDGRRWRLTKQFGRGKRAELFDLTAGRLVAKGPDAEDRANAILGVTDGAANRFALLWTPQGQALGEVSELDDKSGKPLIMSAVEREIEAVAGGSLAQDVRRAVERELGALVTTRGAKKGGPLFEALAERDRLSSELDAASVLAEETAKQRGELGDVREKLDLLSDPKARAELASRLAAAREAFAKASQSTEKLRTAEAQRNEQASRLEVAERAHGDFTRAVSAHEMLTREIEADGERRIVLQREAQVAEAAVQACEKAGEALAQEARRLGELAVGFERAERLRSIQSQLAERRGLLARSRELSDEIGRVNAELKSDPATGERLDTLLRADQARQLAESRLGAVSPLVRVSYETGAAQRFVADGKKIDQGGEFEVRGPLTIEVPGVGRIEVVPGGGADLETHRDLAAANAAEVTRILAVMGVQSIDEARGAHARREKCEIALNDAVSALRSLAPEGVEVLGAEVEELEAGLVSLQRGLGEEMQSDADSDVAREPVGLEELVRQRAEIERKLGTARDDYKSAQKALTQALQALERFGSQADARKVRLDELGDVLGPEAGRALRLNELADALNASRKLANELQRTVIALRDDAVSPNVLDEMKEQVRAAELAVSSRDRAIQELRLRAAELEGRIAAADEASAGLRLSVLQGEFERACGDVERWQGEVAALSLLKQELDAAALGVRDRFQAPVIAALAPYLTAVFGEAGVVFADGFKPVSLQRDGLSEGLENLSDGTREQLSVFVRLAFAKVLDDAGGGGPVILDDPFAYSDDERLRRAFAALHQAARVHQVIVLTCRVGAFSSFDATRLSLSRWEPEARDARSLAG